MSWTLINTSGQRVLDDTFENVLAPSLRRLTIRDGDNWGLMNGESQEWIIQPRYDELMSFPTVVSGGNRGGKYVLVQDNGQEIGKSHFDMMGYFYDGLATAIFEGQYGYLRSDGEWGIPPVFSHAKCFREGRAVVSHRPWMEGYIDTDGNAVTDSKYIVAGNFGEGLAFVKEKNKNAAFIDRMGQKVFEGDWFTSAFPFREGLSMYCTPDEGPNPRVGFLDLHGRPVFDRTFDDASCFTNGIAAVKIKEKWGVIDRAGDLVVPADYDRIGIHAQDLIPAYKDGKCGYITASNEVAIPFEFSQAREFVADGIAVVKLPAD